MRLHTLHLVLAALVGIALAPRSARAQKDALLPMPIAPYASQGRASSVTGNPALLSEVGRWELDLRTYIGYREPRLGFVFSGFAAFRPGRYFALSMGLTRRSEAVRETQDIPTLLLPRSSFSLGAVVGNPEIIALGAAIHSNYLNGERLGAPDLSVGALARWSPFVSLGTAVRHRPRYTDSATTSVRAQTRWNNELAIRPFGTPWLELAGTAEHWMRASFTPGSDLVRNLWQWGGRASATIRGWGLDFSMRQRVRTLDDNALLVDRQDPLVEDREWVWSLGLRVNPWRLGQFEAQTRMQGGKGEALAFSGRFGPGFGKDPRARSRRYDGQLLELDLDAIESDHDLIEVLEALRIARVRYPNPVLVYGSLSKLGWASAQELRQALCAHRKAGGWVFAHLDRVSLRDYYIASVASKIYAAPTASLELYEPGREALYFKQILDRMSIQTEWLHTGPYKTAYERFAQTGPSPNAITQRTRLYDLVQAEFLRGVAPTNEATQPEKGAPDLPALRRASVELSKAMAESPIAAPRAQELKLVDEVNYIDQTRSDISAQLGQAVLDRTSLLTTRDHDAQRRPWGQGAYLGVIVVQGTIVSGKGFEVPMLSNRYAGDESFAEQLETLSQDQNCFGIIVRVNSPGGSAAASDAMWKTLHDYVENEMGKTSKGPWRKPLAVSMGDTAASGGYYLSVAAPVIFAQPLTVTGSIGVTALHWNLSQLLARIGVQRYYFGNESARSPESVFAPWSPAQRENMTRSIDATYDLFLSKVQRGRDLPEDRVRELAGGRVWSGYDAKPRKLIDAWGGYEAARNWVVSMLPARKRRLPLKLRILRPESGFLSKRLQALQARVFARRSADAQGAARLWSALARGLTGDRIAQALLDIAMLPQDASLTWSQNASLTQRVEK